MTKKSTRRIIATADCETDPFEHGLIPRPFVWGFYSPDEGYRNFWSEENCCEQFLAFLDSLDEPHYIYMHNGGRFDFFFLLYAMGGKMRIVNGRILEATIGRHILRDSFAAFPMALSKYKKDDIDYNKLHVDARNDNKDEILHYLEGDVTYLYQIVSTFQQEFGNVLTIGSAALTELKKFHEFDETNEAFDTTIRRFYSGGRNQCFDVGIIKRPLKVYDANSMYPYVMQKFEHPISGSFTVTTEVSERTAFVVVEGINRGALPCRTKTGGLDFTASAGVFYTTIHELQAGIETGTFDLIKVVEAYDFEEWTTFDKFVEHFYSQRMQARLNKELLFELFYKLVLNSAYGKFCTNPDNFMEYTIGEPDEIMPEPWEPATVCGEYIIWQKPSTQRKYYNVATGASITGASRAVLLRGLSNAVRPIYCDTDSIVCDSLNGDLDNNRLGAWKLDGEGDMMAIAGKKLYALYNGAECVKKASKGVKLSGEQIVQVAKGDIVAHINPVPAFKLSGDHQFVDRTIRATLIKPKAFGV